MIINVGAGSGGGASADKITYDNSNSGLEATEVQGAIDEITNSLPVLLYDTDYQSVNNAGVNLTLLDDLTKYKYIIVFGSTSVNTRTAKLGLWMQINTYLLKNVIGQQIQFMYGNQFLGVSYVNDNTIKVQSGSSASTIYGRYVYGIKY